MGKKCYVYACKTNYSSEKLKSDKISVYRFPEDETEKEKWIKAVPNANLRVTRDTVVCELHQPSGFEEIKVNGKSGPKDLPSIWPGVPSSQVPTSSPPTRPTKKLVQAHAALKKINDQSFSDVIK